MQLDLSFLELTFLETRSPRKRYSAVPNLKAAISTLKSGGRRFLFRCRSGYLAQAQCRISRIFDFDSVLCPGPGAAQDQNRFDFDSALRPGLGAAQDQNHFDFDSALRPGGDTAQDHRIGMDFNIFLS